MRKDKNIPVITIILLVINIWMYILTEYTNGMMRDWGGSYAPLILEEHQYYRIITHIFIHYGFDHIFNNMVSLLILGYSLEGIFGRWRFALLYFLSGILAGVTSLVYNVATLPFEEMPLSCGASGAVYGLMGALLVLLIVGNRGLRGAEIARYLLFLGLSLYSGMMDTSIDNAAHIGGFAAGCLIGAIMCHGQRMHGAVNGGKYAS